MKAVFKIVFLSYCILTVVHSAFSQNYSDKKILSGLNNDNKEKLENANEARIYGNELMQQAEALEAQYGISMLTKEDYAPDRIRQMDNKTLNIIRSTVRKKIQASNQYGNANILTSFVYTKDLKMQLMQSTELEKANINILLEQSKYLLTEGRTIRGKSMRIENEFLVYPHLIDANKIEKQAINKLIEAYAIIYRTESGLNGAHINVQEVQSQSFDAGVHFRIQLAATRKQLKGEKLKQIAPKNEIVSSDFSNGWYKYALSRNFGTYQEAVDYKESMNLNEAFIISYIGSRRVSIAEAVALQGQNSYTPVENSLPGTVYRLRLWISTQPATNKTLSGIKSGGKPIMMFDHGGWYTYTVGDFSTKQEANRFKINKGLTDAVIVQYKNGKPAENN